MEHGVEALAVDEHVGQLQGKFAHGTLLHHFVRLYAQQSARVAEPQLPGGILYGGAVYEKGRYHTVGAAVFHPLAIGGAAEDTIGCGQPEASVGIFYEGARLTAEACGSGEGPEIGHGHIGAVDVAVLGEEVEPTVRIFIHLLEFMPVEKSFREYAAAYGASGGIVDGKTVFGAYPSIAFGVEEYGVDIAFRKLAVGGSPVLSGVARE